MMAINFTPHDWYWRVAGSTTQVYSSKVGNYVPVEDATYVTWLANPTHATSNIANEAELGEVLASFSLRPVAANLLDAYTESHANKLTVEVAAKLFFNIVNEIRVLKGQSALSAAQFKAYVKGLM
jgi:hypothetical protein